MRNADPEQPERRVALRAGHTGNSSLCPIARTMLKTRRNCTMLLPASNYTDTKHNRPSMIQLSYPATVAPPRPSCTAVTSVGGLNCYLADRSGPTTSVAPLISRPGAGYARRRYGADGHQSQTFPTHIATVWLHWSPRMRHNALVCCLTRTICINKPND